MAVTQFQARILKMLASNRIKEGETYVAGGLRSTINCIVRGCRTTSMCSVTRMKRSIARPERIVKL